jgi:poly(hydroxyalkanoate) depolymerase family esterase
MPGVRSSADAVPGRGTWRGHVYRGLAGRREYFVYVPGRLGRGRVPVLVALHGCGQTAADLAVSTRFNQLADRHRMVVVYPQQPPSHHGQRCWNWFHRTNQRRGGGEPAILVGIVERVLSDRGLQVDPARIYLAGLSAGGAMAMTLAAAYPELWAAVAVHSAPPPRSAGGPQDAFRAMQGATTLPAPPPGATGLPPMIVFQGRDDAVVRPANAARIARQWMDYQHADSAAAVGALGPARVRIVPPARSSSPRARRGYRVISWRARFTRTLEVWLIDGLGHAWSGGAEGQFSDPRGPRATTEMWRFFAGKRSGSRAVARAG